MATNDPNRTPAGAARPWAWWLLCIALAAGGGFAYYATSPSSAPPSDALKGVSTGLATAITRDQRLLRTANTNAALADTATEQAYAAQAAKLADEVLDRAFAIALEQAAQAAIATPPAAPKATQDALTQAAKAVADEQATVARLQAEAKTSADRAAAVQPQLDLAQARLALDQARQTDVQTDAERDAASDSDRLQQIEHEHEASEHPSPGTTAIVGGAQSSLLTGQASERNSRLVHGLVGEFEAAYLLNDKVTRLQNAQAAAQAAGEIVLASHDKLHAQLQSRLEQVEKPAASAPPGAATAPAPAAAAGSEKAQLATLNSLTQTQKTLSRLDDQNATLNDLVTVYGQWIPVARNQRASAFHAALRVGLILLGFFIALGLIRGAVKRTVAHLNVEPRRAHTLVHMVRLVSRSFELVAVLIALFGPPQELLTLAGIMAAGLSVAFQDAILSLAGWFVLIGRSGIRLGDWVEINGTAGEVTEFHLLRTVLLETGNWIETGHPTGRRVYFPNSFVFQGSYFNFSNSGQWLWDELRIRLPADIDHNLAVAHISEVLQREANAVLKEAQTRGGAGVPAPEALSRSHAPFSTAPSVQLKPEDGELTLAVRYVVPAPQRSEMRARMYGAILSALDAVRQESVSASTAKA